jgi:hypothetical protein
VPGSHQLEPAINTFRLTGTDRAGKSVANGLRVMVGTAEWIADELQEWLYKDAADGFNVVCNDYPGPFYDFTNLVIPELQRRGVFRTPYEGKTLRDSLGLEVSRNRYARQMALPPSRTGEGHERRQPCMLSTWDGESGRP